MFIIRNSVRSLLIIAFITVEADYMAINWNISTRQGYSHIEREYKYPMYEEVAPVPCDLTDSCDVFCSQDSDCDNLQKLSFPPAKLSTECDGPLSVFDCSCNKFEKPEWLSVFCYVYKNPIYLGKFFETRQKIEKLGTLKNLIGKKRRNLFNQQEYDVKNKANIINQYGSPVMTFVPMSESFPSVNSLLSKVPLKDFSFACKLTPVRYGFASSTVCLNKITQNLCENGYILSVLPYLVQGSNPSTHSDIPIVLKDLNILKGIKTEVSIKCIDLKSKTKKLKKQDMNFFQQKTVKPCNDALGMYPTFFENSTCQNVLVYVQYEFLINGSEIVKLKVEYGLTNLPISNDKYSDINSKYIYLKQRFGITFFDVATKVNDKRIYTADDELLNRGYFVGEELNFGYKHTENSSTSWKKGMLGVFSNGESCDTFSPITFGFDYFSVCRIGKFSNCSQLRTTAEEKFDALLKGDSLAAYSNLRAPYSHSVPVLRSHPDSSQRVSEPTAGCSVPVVQDVRIQYTTVFTEGGKAIHRVLGIRIDRASENVTARTDVMLTCRVFFSYVSSAKAKPRSRFWQRMHSPELSENSWLRILNAFDDVTPDESEEITFWCVLLALLFSAAVAFVKLDVDLGEFFHFRFFSKFLHDICRVVDCLVSFLTRRDGNDDGIVFQVFLFCFPLFVFLFYFCLHHPEISVGVDGLTFCDSH